MATNLKNPTPNKTKSVASTLNFLQVAEIRDSVLVLRESQIRSILAVSSTNFALKSDQEKEMIIGTFQGILNSIDFPLQIVVQNRKVNLDTYIEKLKVLQNNQQNELLRTKMQEYIEYIQNLIQDSNIMEKNFYIVVGYDPITLKEGIFGSFLRALNPARIVKQKQEDFMRNRKMLMTRVDEIASKMGGLDLKVALLNTEQLIALMYNCYNPDTTDSVRLKDISSIDVEV
jgi:hypothetical protein